MNLFFLQSRQILGPSIAVAMAVSLLLALLSEPEAAFAHANVEISDPASEEELDEAPKRIVIQFTEPLEPQFSGIKVLDANGQQVDGTDSNVDLTDRTVMSVSLPALENGTYTVSWVNVSAVDGHRVNGAYVFAVGEPISGAIEVADEPILQSQREPIFRWLVLTGALVAAGGIAFRVLILTAPLAVISRGRGVSLVLSTIQRRGESIVWIGIAVTAIGSILQLIQQAATTFGVSFFDAIGSELPTIVFDTDWGSEWLLRMVLLGVFAVGLLIARGAFLKNAAPSGLGQWRDAWFALLLIPGAGVLFALSRISHGAGTPGMTDTGFLLDFVHIISAAIWVGGVFQLAVILPILLRHRSSSVMRRILVRTVPRFSAIALISAIVLVLTGSVSAWTQLAAWGAFDTAYGYALISKLIIILPLLILAAINLLWVRPRLSGVPSSSAALFRKVVTAEVVVMLMVLLAAGYLTALEPGRQVASREAAAQGPSFEETEEGATIRTDLSHARVGPNDITVTLTDRRGDRIDDASNVEFIMTGLGAGIPSDLARATDTGEGVWILEDYRMSVAGRWQIETVVRRPGNFDARTAFRFDLGGTGAGGSTLFAANPQTAGVLLGGVTLLTGLLILFSSVPLGSIYTRSGLGIAGPGLAIAVVGVLIVGVNFSSSSEDASKLQNPFPPTADSIALGEIAYTATCSACHRVQGLGGGPSASSLASPPADLSVHVPLHLDGDLFSFMRDGISDTPMKSLSNVLSEDEMWHLVNYIRELARQ